MADLSGQVAVVVGSSSGMGRAAAQACAGAGAKVVLAARRAGELRGAGRRDRRPAPWHVPPT